MKYVNLKCENCNANLKVDIEHGAGYCPYCGAQVYADYSDSVLKEKEKTKRAKYKEDTEIFKTKNKSAYAQQKENNDFLNLITFFLIMVIICELIMLLLCVGYIY